MSNEIKIDKIVLHHIKIPLQKPFRISVGEVTEKEFVLVEGRFGDITGWGEAAVDWIPFYTSETVGTAMSIGQSLLGPLVMERGWSSPEALCDGFEKFRGHRFAKAAFETMFWDIYGKVVGKSASSLLGGTRQWVECGPSIGIQETPRQLVENVAEYLEKGYRRIKMKVSPGKDKEYLAAVRAQFPDITLMVDGNNAYKSTDMEHLASWDDYNLLMIEQPLNENDLYYHSILRKHLKTPICLDESIETPYLAESAIKLESADIVNIKVGRVGGMVNSKKVHDICEAAGIPVWVGSRIGSSLADAMRIAIASLSNAKYPSDLGFHFEYMADDIVEDYFEKRNGCEYKVPTTPGMGLEVDRAKLKQYAVTSVEL
ncbi:MAG: o-succinylbenzoate synthase [Phycisphaerae bacterium]|nr:o-succinylbenzoate synthase [Phycisphaerae bacterium]